MNKASMFLRLAFGIDLQQILAYRNLPRFIADRNRFKKAGGRITKYFPVLNEFEGEYDVASGDYFHQDLLVAGFIYKANPNRHVDIGSSVSGFVAHVASFRMIEIMDIRALPPSEHENIKFTQADLMVDSPDYREIADSVSCLHTLEHFGLGRYGDPIDPTGHLKGFSIIRKMPTIGGSLYLSFPIGNSTRVHFNGHRVFHPQEILSWPGHEHLDLVRFDYVDERGRLHKEFPVMESVPDLRYGCGIYSFRRRS